MLEAVQLHRGGCGWAAPPAEDLRQAGPLSRDLELALKRFPIPAWGAWPAPQPPGPAHLAPSPVPASARPHFWVWHVVLGSGGARPGSLPSTAEGVGPPGRVCTHPGSALQLSFTSLVLLPRGWLVVAPGPEAFRRPGSPGRLLCRLQDQRTGGVNSLGTRRGAQAVGQHVLPWSLGLQECWVKRGMGGQAPGRPMFHGGMRPPCPLPPPCPPGLSSGITPARQAPTRCRSAHQGPVVCGQAASWLSPVHGQVDKRPLRGLWVVTVFPGARPPACPAWARQAWGDACSPEKEILNEKVKQGWKFTGFQVVLTFHAPPAVSRWKTNTAGRRQCRP